MPPKYFWASERTYSQVLRLVDVCINMKSLLPVSILHLWNYKPSSPKYLSTSKVVRAVASQQDREVLLSPFYRWETEAQSNEGYKCGKAGV